MARGREVIEGPRRLRIRSPRGRRISWLKRRRQRRWRRCIVCWEIGIHCTSIRSFRGRAGLRCRFCMVSFSFFLFLSSDCPSFSTQGLESVWCTCVPVALAWCALPHLVSQVAPFVSFRYAAPSTTPLSPVMTLENNPLPQRRPSLQSTNTYSC